MKHLLTLLLLATSAFGQGAGVTTEVDDQGKARIVLEARGFLPEVPFLFSATATSEITVHPAKWSKASSSKRNGSKAKARSWPWAWPEMGP